MRWLLLGAFGAFVRVLITGSLSFNFIDKNYRFIERTVHCLKILIWFLHYVRLAECVRIRWVRRLGTVAACAVQCKFHPG